MKKDSRQRACEVFRLLDAWSITDALGILRGSVPYMQSRVYYSRLDAIIQLDDLSKGYNKLKEVIKKKSQSTEDLDGVLEHIAIVRSAIVAGKIKCTPDGYVNPAEFIEWAESKGLIYDLRSKSSAIRCYEALISELRNQDDSDSNSIAISYVESMIDYLRDQDDPLPEQGKGDACDLASSPPVVPKATNDDAIFTAQSDSETRKGQLVKEYIKSQRLMGIPDETIAYRLHCTRGTTYLEIARLFGLEKGLNDDQIDARKQRGKRFCDKGKPADHKIVTA